MDEVLSESSPATCHRVFKFIRDDNVRVNVTVEEEASDYCMMTIPSATNAPWHTMLTESFVNVQAGTNTRIGRT